MNMEWLNSTPDLTWLQLILISFIGNLCGSLLCTYIDRYEAKKNKKKKTINQKVKNATPNIYDGIEFKSKLETYVYKQLKAHNLKAEYEPINLN